MNNTKFKGVKASNETIAAISRTCSESEFERREAVFAKHRSQLQGQLRLVTLLVSSLKSLVCLLFSNPQNRISQVSTGFWKNSQHLANQFQYLTGTNLTAVVKENLVVQIGSAFYRIFSKS